MKLTTRLDSGSASKRRPVNRPTSKRPRIDVSPIAAAIQNIADQLNPEETWLFGSRAEGRARPDSDYDLLVVMPDEATESQLDPIQAWRSTCNLGIGIGIDLSLCTRSEFEAEKNAIGTLAREAYQRGQRIYVRKK